MPSIVIIIPYFGQWPVWIELFFDSCRRNHDVDFIFYTDCCIPESSSGNMTFHSISFNDYCTIVSERLGIHFCPARPYKLCDLRPFYGVIHANEIRGYDFWGFADVDLVFGNIRKFYTNGLLANYKLLSNHSDRISGHLCIFKNEESINNKCFQIHDWEQKIIDDKNHCLDEGDFSYRFFPESRFLLLIFRKICKYIGWNVGEHFHEWAFPPFAKLAAKKGFLYKQMNVHPVWSGSSVWEYQVTRDMKAKPIVYDRGKCEECIYCHFLPWKKNWKGEYYKVSDSCHTYKITESGIEDASSDKKHIGD